MGEREAGRKHWNMFLNMSGSINRFVYRIQKLQKKIAYIVRNCVLAIEASLGLPERHKHIVNYPAKCEMPGRRFTCGWFQENTQKPKARRM